MPINKIISRTNYEKGNKKTNKEMREARGQEHQKVI